MHSFFLSKRHRVFTLTALVGFFLAPVLHAADAPAKAEPTAPEKRADDEKKPEPSLVQRVLDAQGLAELSLERLLDLPVVTASGKAEERSLAAANVFIVGRDEIERRGYGSLGEILRRVPGLYLSYDYVNPSLGVREVTGGYFGATRIVKIMVDGFPVSFRPDLEAFLGPEFIPVEAIDRVEVAKGPLSALYGANAFLATVNVITREPEERRLELTQRYMVVNGNPGMGTSAMATYAGLDTSLLLAASAERVDRSGVRSSQTFRHQIKPPPGQTNPALLEDSKDDLSKPTSLFGRFDYHHDKAGDFRLEASYQELDSEAEFSLNSVMTHRSRVHLSNEWLALSWQKHQQALDLHASLGLSHGAPKEDYQLFLTSNLNSSFRPRFDYTALNGQAEVSYDFGHWLQADVGGDFELSNEGVLYYTQTIYHFTESASQQARRYVFQQEDLINQGESRSYDHRQLGAYLQLRSAPFVELPDLRFTGAARADRIDFGDVGYPLQTSFRGALAYRFGPKLTARLIGGRAFQTPSGTLLFAQPGFGNSEQLQGSERLGDPQKLVPQTVTSAEFVASSQLFSFLSIEASAFYQDLNDAIRFLQTGQFIVARNGGRVSTVGAELFINAQFGRVRPYVAVSVSRQLDAEVPRGLRGITDFSGSPSMYPRAFGYAGFDVELLRSTLFFNTELFWAGERGASQANYYQNDGPYSLPSYQTLDLTLSTGNLPLLGRETATKFLVSLRNALDTRYLEPGFSGVDIPQPGSALLLQLKQSL